MTVGGPETSSHGALSKYTSATVDSEPVIALKLSATQLNSSSPAAPPPLTITTAEPWPSFAVMRKHLPQCSPMPKLAWLMEQWNPLRR